MWRQGDVFIERADKVPADAVSRPTTILVEGELTGHAHRVRDRRSAAVYAAGADLYLDVQLPEAVIEHEEHGPITLPKGAYRVWQQREYTPGAIRTVAD